MIYNDGFLINEESRQHINLSTYAMKIIEADMIRFNDDYELKNKSGFINTIISNHFDAFPLSKSVSLKQINTIQQSIKRDEFSDKVTHKVIEEFTKEIMKNNIYEYAEKYSSDVQFKLKINKNNKELLESLDEAKFFEEYAPRSGIGFYLKIIVESYAEQIKEVRERIYFKETIEKIEGAIESRCIIKLLSKKTNQKISPLAIYKPYDSHSLELIYSVDDIDSTTQSIYTIKIKELTIQGFRILKEKSSDIEGDSIKKLLEEKSTISAKPKQTFKIKFSSAGLKRFIYEEDSIPIIGIPDQEDKYLYNFQTTETHIFNYLFKYGLQARIVSPIDVRDRFKKLFKASYEAYESEDQEELGIE